MTIFIPLKMHIIPRDRYDWHFTLISVVSLCWAVATYGRILTPSILFQVLLEVLFHLCEVVVFIVLVGDREEIVVIVVELNSLVGHP